MAALPIPYVTDLRALPVGRREDGEPSQTRQRELERRLKIRLQLASGRPGS
jgi:hypothetical protein